MRSTQQWPLQSQLPFGPVVRDYPAYSCVAKCYAEQRGRKQTGVLSKMFSKHQFDVHHQTGASVLACTGPNISPPQWRFGQKTLKTRRLASVIAIPTCREWQSARHRLGWAQTWQVLKTCQVSEHRLAMLRERLLRFARNDGSSESENKNAF